VVLTVLVVFSPAACPCALFPLEVRLGIAVTQGPSGPVGFFSAGQQGPSKVRRVPVSDSACWAGQFRKINPLQLGLLKWAPSFRLVFQVEGRPLGVAYDGATLWVTTQGATR